MNGQGAFARCRLFVSTLWVNCAAQAPPARPVGRRGLPIWVGIFALVALGPLGAQAASYQATGRLAYQLGFTNITLDQYDETLSGGASGDAEGEASYLTVTANSAANGSGLRTQTYTVFDKPDVSGTSETYTASANAGAIAVWDDFLITGPTGSGTVSISLNLHLDGTFTLVGDDTPSASFPAVASGNVSVGIWAMGNNVGSGQYMRSIRNGVTTSEGTGILSGFSGDNVIHSLTFNAPVNTPFTLELTLGITAGIGVQYNQSVHLESGVDFGNTLTFATDGPVFDLPEGYTINSAEAGVVNNVAVPEPGALFLALTAAPLLLMARRRMGRD